MTVRVTCGECGAVETYDGRALSWEYPESRWRCPSCGHEAELRDLSFRGV